MYTIENDLLRMITSSFIHAKLFTCHKIVFSLDVGLCRLWSSLFHYIPHICDHVMHLQSINNLCAFFAVVVLSYIAHLQSISNSTIFIYKSIYILWSGFVESDFVIGRDVMESDCVIFHNAPVLFYKHSLGDDDGCTSGQI